MVLIRRAAERGHFDHGWLDTYHTFSFGDYQDNAHMDFRTLRVLNDDVVQPGGGFGMHPHRDMEIITYVVSGELAHRDSTSGSHPGGATLAAGGFQVMTAGTGLMHSEFNPSPTAPVRIMQVWIRPNARGLTPAYVDRPASKGGPAGQWDLVAAGRAHGAQTHAASSNAPALAARAEVGAQTAADAYTDAVLPIHQDACVYHALLPTVQTLKYTLAPGRGAWVQVVDGSVELNGERLERGDGAAIEDEGEIRSDCAAGSDVLLFDLG